MVYLRQSKPTVLIVTHVFSSSLINDSLFDEALNMFWPCFEYIMWAGPNPLKYNCMQFFTTRLTSIEKAAHKQSREARGFFHSGPGQNWTKISQTGHRSHKFGLKFHKQDTDFTNLD